MKGPQCHNFCQKTHKLSNECQTMVIKFVVKRKKSTNIWNESFRSDKHTQRKALTEKHDTTNHMRRLLFWNFITCRAKLLNADWLRQRAFFLNQEGTFGDQEGMITWCWLAEQACIKLVSRFKRILKRNFRNASLLSLILLVTRSFHLNVKENQDPTKRSLLVEKPKNFSDQKRIDSQPENSLNGDGWCWTKH